MSFQNILANLDNGSLRAAFKNKQGIWEPNTEIKAAILDAFKAGKIISYDNGQFFDKNTTPLKKFSIEQSIRLVPGGSSVRFGSYIGKNTVIMPPSFVNIGAYIDDCSMIDSHVLVGSCAQIGKNVHISAGVTIGGVLEPIGQRPVIIEDDCFIGAGATIVEGIIIEKGAVIAPGVVLTSSVPIYDCVTNKILEKGSNIPKNAVVIPASRPIKNIGFAKDVGIHIQCPVIIKYKDEGTDKKLALEHALR